MVKLQDIQPADIEAESFRIIEKEFPTQTGKKIEDYSREEFLVLQRIIHATGDFQLADQLIFQHDAIGSAIRCLHSGGDIITDVTMVASGISRNILSTFGGQVRCGIADAETARLAAASGITRSEAAMHRLIGKNVAIAAIGNAPTALIALLRAIDKGAPTPGLVIGVPVGFVNAAESKELLTEYPIPAITLRGRRGGSPIAAAIANAILRIAENCQPIEV